MLAPTEAAGAEGMSSDQRSHVMVGAIRALSHLRVAELVSSLRMLKEKDPDMRVRQAAIEALGELEGR